jgi:hypothetical protein
MKSYESQIRRSAGRLATAFATLSAFTMPAEAGNSAESNISLVSNAPCPSGAPPNANCATYALIEPPSNPRFAYFTTGTISYPPHPQAPRPLR